MGISKASIESMRQGKLVMTPVTVRDSPMYLSWLPLHLVNTAYASSWWANSISHPSGDSVSVLAITICTNDLWVSSRSSNH